MIVYLVLVILNAIVFGLAWGEKRLNFWAGVNFVNVVIGSAIIGSAL